MEKNFLTVIHEAEIMDPQSLEMLKGGTSPFDCQSFSCTCYKVANAVVCKDNKKDPDKTTTGTTPTTDTTTPVTVDNGGLTNTSGVVSK